MQTVQLDPISEDNRVQHEWPQVRGRQTALELVPQVPYRLARRQAEFVDPSVIKFVVDGQEGIRLSDASEGNWEGFEGGDDRSPFGGDRSQILIRFRVSCLVGVQHELTN